MWNPGSRLTVQGNEDRSLFVVLSGTAQVLVDDEVVGQVQSGDSFGEIAMLHQVPRRATIQAASAMTTSRLDRDELFRALGVDQGERTIQDLLGFEHLSSESAEPGEVVEGDDISGV